MLRHHRSLVVASQAVRYRHPIPPFRPYEIRSQLIFADQQWMYLLHRFQCPTTGKLYAEGLCRATCRQNGGHVSAATLFSEVVGGDPEALRTLPKEMPAMVRELLEWDASTRYELETTAEASRRATETQMPSDKALTRSWKPLQRLTQTWNLPI